MKKIEIAVIVVALGAVSSYWSFRVHQRKQQLALIAIPLQEVCQSVTGCASAPVGWEKQRDSEGGIAYHMVHDGLDMAYTATQTDFRISWHIGTDVYLIATGGKGKQMVIKKEMD